jgi:hypothetical protein
MDDAAPRTREGVRACARVTRDPAGVRVARERSFAAPVRVGFAAA